MGKNIELESGTIVNVRDVVIDTDGTNLVDGISISKDGVFIGNLIGYSAGSENLVEIIEKYFEIY